MTMRKSKKRIKKKVKKKTSRKKRSKANSRRNNQPKSVNLQKMIGFNFKSFSKAYENFTENRKKEKAKQDKLKNRSREKQNKEEQSVLSLPLMPSKSAMPPAKEKTDLAYPYQFAQSKNACNSRWQMYLSCHPANRTKEHQAERNKYRVAA